MVQRLVTTKSGDWTKSSSKALLAEEFKPATLEPRKRLPDSAECLQQLSREDQGRNEPNITIEDFNTATAVDTIISKNKELQRRLVEAHKLVDSYIGIVDIQKELIAKTQQELREAVDQIKSLTANVSELLFLTDSQIEVTKERPQSISSAQTILSDLWVCDPDNHRELQEAEFLIMDGRYQRALIHLEKHEKALPKEQKINALLLKACTLRVCDKPADGLVLAEMAIALADKDGLYAHVSKGQMYRGLCLMDLGWFGEASWCFTRAANVRWFAKRVAEWKMLAEEKKQELPKGDEKRLLRMEFQTIPPLLPVPLK